MQVQGVMKGKYIELPHTIGIPDGMTIVLDIHIFSPTFEEQQDLIDQLCGSWAHDPSLPEIFAEIDRQRQRSLPRDAHFDLSS